jgi:hypothetical protein
MSNTRSGTQVTHEFFNNYPQPFTTHFALAMVQMPERTPIPEMASVRQYFPFFFDRQQIITALLN